MRGRILSYMAKGEDSHYVWEEGTRLQMSGSARSRLGLNNNQGGRVIYELERPDFGQAGKAVASKRKSSQVEYFVAETKSSISFEGEDVE